MCHSELFSIAYGELTIQPQKIPKPRYLRNATTVTHLIPILFILLLEGACGILDHRLPELLLVFIVVVVVEVDDSGLIAASLFRLAAIAVLGAVFPLPEGLRRLDNIVRIELKQMNFVMDLCMFLYFINMMSANDKESTSSLISRSFT